METPIFNQVYNFWFANPKFWIPITPKDKSIADKIIYDTFFNKYQSLQPIDISGLDKEAKIGVIIFYDQLLRHFKRYLEANKLASVISEVLIESSRIQLLPICKSIDFTKLNENELIFVLMPLKHLEQYHEVLNSVLIWISIHNQPIKSYHNLSNFFNDTYKKCYTFEKIAENIHRVDMENKPLDFNPLLVCDYYDDTYLDAEEWLDEVNFKNPDIFSCKELTTLLKTTENKSKIIVSLSGGVDSMVTLFLLERLIKMEKLTIPVVACHIIYGNRQESMMEFEIIKEFCNRLKIPLYYYKIEYLRRSEIDREFYEKMTRDIRFHVYRALSTPDSGVYLGHIKDDVIENIWSNFAKGQHIFDLKKMTTETKQDGITLIRPFLEVDKTKILEISEYFWIPYLKNTTPVWSNRGKFRNRFYQETHEQYGKQVDEKIMEVATTLSNVGKILENLIYKPIFNSFSNNVVDISRAMEAELDVNGWLYILTEICHHHLKMTKPSLNSVEQFMERVNKYKNDKNLYLRFQMKSNLQMVLYQKEGKYLLKFIC